MSKGMKFDVKVDGEVVGHFIEFMQEDGSSVFVKYAFDGLYFGRTDSIVEAKRDIINQWLKFGPK